MLGSYVKYLDFNGTSTFVINDRNAQPLLHASSPYYFISVLNADGLYNADISYESHPIPNATGEKSGDVFRRGKTITLSGKITSLNYGGLLRGAEYLQHMFQDTRLRKLVWTRREDSIEVYYKGKVSQDVTVVQSVQDGKYSWDWIVGIRTDTPFTYKTSDNSLYPTWQA